MRRKKNHVKRINNEEVMAVSVKTSIAEKCRTQLQSCWKTVSLAWREGATGCLRVARKSTVLAKNFYFNQFRFPDSFKYVLSYV
ncbi:hypothetical protein HanIR_Chr09g0395751 [Helianthus annuus]|nr:hypothetical protein HanIR_Chr09g0395751 [Helianthus annuus]